MSSILIKEVPQVFCGLGTLTKTIYTAGIYNVQCQSTEIPVSTLQIVVNQNGSPVYTSPALSPTQSAFQFRTALNCAVNDAITVVISSTGPSANDSLLNSVKTSVSIGSGL